MHTILITDNLFNQLSAMAKEINTQDNRMTSDPIFEVRQDDHEDLFAKAYSFFTNKAAERFISDNAHHLVRPYIYVNSAWRNYEWQAVRELLNQIENGKVK